MAEFNPATMLDVSQDYYCSFTATRSGTDLLVTAKSYGDLLPGMVVTGSGIGSFIVQERLAVSGSELERWRTYNLTADFDAVLSKTTLTVSNVRSGTVSGRISLSIDGEYNWVIGAQSTGTTGGAGTYAITSGYGTNDGYQFSSGRWFSYALSGETVSSATAMSGRLFGASTTAATSGESLKISRIGGAARYAGKALYFPPGAYVLIHGMVGSSWTSKVALVGKSSSGADTQRSILRADYNTPLWDMEHNPKAVQDLRLEGIRLNTCSTVTGCYVWMPDAETVFTGRVSGTTLTVETLPADGFITVGQTLKSGNTTLGTITGLLSGSPNTVGSTFALSASATVATGSTLSATVSLGAHYFHTATGDITIRDSVWSVPGVYINLLIQNPTNLLLHNNEFVSRPGRTWHVVRVEPSDGLADQLVLTHNKIHRHCVTGIFVISNRLATIRNLVMDWNEVSLNEEEALSLDGIGDSVGYVPVICNGRLTSLSNRSDGRLVVSLAQMLYVPAPGTTALSPVSVRCENVVGYVSGDVLSATTINTYTAIRSLLKGSGVPSGTQIVEYLGLSGSTHSYRLNKSFTLGSVGSPVTMRQGDWNKFNFVFSSGTGADGAIAGIVDYDESANTLTLDSTLVAGTLTTGAATWAGVHAGFFGGSVCHNKIGGYSKSGLNANGDYSSAISLYLNVFGLEVAHNEVNGQATGIKVVGGYMQSAYHLLAYNNSLHDNLVVGSDVGVISIFSGLPQVGNRVYANTIINGKVNLLGETDTLCEGNILVGDNAKVVRTYVTPTLPAIPS